MELMSSLQLPTHSGIRTFATRVLFATTALTAWAALGCTGSSRVTLTAGRFARTQHCATYTVNRGGPQCIRELTANEVRQRTSSWSLGYDQQGRVVHTYEQNGRGFKQADEFGSVEYEFIYRGDVLTEIRGLDRAGNINDREVFNSEGTRVDYVDEWGRTKVLDSTFGVAEVRKLDKRGFVTEIRNLGLDGRPAQSKFGVYVERIERDDRGLVKKSCYFNPDGSRTLGIWGVHCIEYTRNDWGTAASLRYLDQNGNPTQNLVGAHAGVYHDDAFGNHDRIEWFGLDGKLTPVADVPGRCATWVGHVDNGVWIGGECLDERGKPNRFREGHSSWRDTIDAQGRVTHTRRFGPDGEPLRSGNFAEIRYLYDEHDFVTTTQFLQPDGSLGQKGGPASIIRQRNRLGLVIKESYLDHRNQDTSVVGCTYREFEWNQFRQQSRCSCFDARHQPAYEDSGASIVQNQYSAEGLLREVNYFGIDAKPRNGRQGYTKAILKYDAQGTLQGRLFYDVDNRQVVLPAFRVIRGKPYYEEYNHITAERQRTLGRLEAARHRLNQGDDFISVALRFSDIDFSIRQPGDPSYWDLKAAAPQVRAALENLTVGEISSVVELSHGMFVYQRIE